MSVLSTEQERQIRELIAHKQKITAIKLYREATGSSLKEAKDAVEAIERGGAIDIPLPAQVAEIDAFLENRIKRLLAERKKIEAVKVYREAYNCGLKDAKDAVDLIQAEMRKEARISLPSAPAISNNPFEEDTHRNRRFLAFLIAIVLLVIGGIAFFLLASSGF